MTARLGGFPAGRFVCRILTKQPSDPDALVDDPFWGEDDPPLRFCNSAKAVQGIIRVVTWFANNAARLASLMNAIFSSISAIAAGNIGGAANFIEQSLATALPTVISFLADLLGLGGISKKVQGIIEKVQAPIKKAIDWVVQKAVAMGKRMWGMAKGAVKGKGKGEGEDAKDGDPAAPRQTNGEDSRTLEEKRADVEAAAQEADAVLASSEATPENIGARLEPIKEKYHLTSLGLEKKDDFTYSAKAVINPEKSSKPHALFKLKASSIKRSMNADGSTELSYETFNGQHFEVTVSADKLKRTIKSEDLVFKGDDLAGERGYVGDSEGYTKRSNANRSHLIADEFCGSGYKNSLNLITTSAHYNQKVMRGAERDIGDFVEENKATRFALTVTVTFGELDETGFKRCVRADLLSIDPNLADDPTKLDQEVDKVFANRNAKLKNCMGVEYVATVSKGSDNVKQTFSIGPDEWKLMEDD